MNKALLTRLSQTISYALHPLIVPTWAVLLLLFGHTIMSGVSLQIKGFFLAIVLLNTLIIPTLCIGLLRTLKVIPDWSLNEPKHRIIPMLIVALGYISCAFMLSHLMLAF